MAKVNIIPFFFSLAVIVQGPSCKFRQASKLAEDSSANSTSVIIVSDTEGMQESLQARINDGSLRIIQNSNRTQSLDFGPNGIGAEFLFAGDLGGRGPNGIWLLSLFLEFKKKYPSRVHLIPGNHDDGRLAILRDLDANFSDTSSLDVLNREFSRSSPKDDAELKLANFVVEWFSRYGLRHALEHHLQELRTNASDNNVTLEYAALDFFAMIRPGGKFFEYLSLCEDVYAKAPLIAVHGGLTEENFGFVGGNPLTYKQVNIWTEAIRERRKSDFTAMREVFAGKKEMRVIRGLYTVVYGDAKYDPATKTLVARNESVIYPFRYKDEGNFRIWPKPIITTLKDQGFHIGVVGHSPVPVPTVLTVDGFTLIMADTSFAGSEQKLANKVTILKDDSIFIQGKFQGGQTFEQVTKPVGNLPIGKVLAGFILVGEDGKGGYFGYRYGEGFKIEVNTFSKDEFSRLSGSGNLIEPWNTLSEDWKVYTERLIGLLKQRGIQFLEIPGNVHDKIEGAETLSHFLTSNKSKPVWIMGYYKTSFANLSPDKKIEIEKLIDKMVSDAALSGDTFITSGTTAGVEGMLHRKVAEYNSRTNGRKINLVGAIHALKNPGELDPLIKNFTLVSRDYGGALDMLAPVVKEQNGRAVIIGASNRFAEQFDAITRSNLERSYWNIDFENNSVLADIAAKNKTSVASERSKSLIVNDGNAAPISPSNSSRPCPHYTRWQLQR